MSPLDVVDTHSNLIDQEQADRQANMVLAQRLEPYEPELAAALRLCASGGPSCNKRICRRCNRARTARFASRRKTKLDRMLFPHHVTVTEYPTEDLTRLALDQTRARFTLLRRKIKREERLNVLGGLANIEIALTEDDRWLPHLHAVIDAPLPPTENWLRETWQALGGGRQVRITPIMPGTQKAVFAYGTKSPVIPESRAMLQQLVTASKGFRAMSPFGNFHHSFGKLVTRRAPASAVSPRPPKPPKPVFFADLLKKDKKLRAEVERLVGQGGGR